MHGYNGHEALYQKGKIQGPWVRLPGLGRGEYGRIVNMY